MQGVAPPSGRTIVLELVQEMERGLYPLLYRILPPSVYHVYLHPEDYRQVEAITSSIVADAQRALGARVEERNAQSRWSTFIKGKEAPIEVPATGWEISLHADPNAELDQGELGIVSRLSLPPPRQFEGGTPTTRIVRSVITGTIRRSTTSEEPEIEGSKGFARLAYVDDQGPHVFVMRKELVTIGRGGSAHWVDVQVMTGTRVSREHCRIRRSPEGRFFLQDVSTWGTSVDGQLVPPFTRQSGNAQSEETGQERELSRDARIQLADALLIEFHA